MSDTILKLRDHQGRLLIPGVQFKENQLVIDDELEGDRLKELTKFLISAHNSSLWWLGDLLCFLKATKGQLWADEVAAQSDDSLRLNEAAHICGQFKERYKVSFQHHRDAFLEAGRDPVKAATWLKRAEENGWSVSEMRRAIRDGNRVGKERINVKGSVTITGAIASLRFTMNRILQERPISEWELEQIIALKTDIQPILDLAQMIDARLNELAAEFQG
jgi:hypothetical protein